MLHIRLVMLTQLLIISWHCLHGFSMVLWLLSEWLWIYDRCVCVWMKNLNWWACICIIILHDRMLLHLVLIIWCVVSGTQKQKLKVVNFNMMWLCWGASWGAMNDTVLMEVSNRWWQIIGLLVIGRMLNCMTFVYSVQLNQAKS